MIHTIEDILQPIYVQRWNGIVHVLLAVGHHGLYPISVDRNGRVMQYSFPGTLICGQKVKMGGGSSNRIVETHPTCIRCIGGLA